MGIGPNDVGWWCGKTPNPVPCEYYLSNAHESRPIKDEADFIKISMQLALEDAIHAESNVHSLGPKFRNKLEKAAWSGCLKLYELAILSLNEVGDFSPNCIRLPSMMSNNVSELISNAMALNKSSSSLASQADIVLAQIGLGNYNTINEVISATSSRSGSGSYVIYVKAGTYSENVEIGGNLKNIMMVGNGIAVDGDAFIGRDITFRNTAGPNNRQAVALRSGSDHSVFYRCSFEGYQGSLCVHANKQFYRECDIYGTVDFIFGNATAVLQNC
ncbi:Plasmodesmata-located protein 8 isoform 1 [Hibiscus syriacus]|uniref:Pectinesterase n=1 Tax=Hibiscus syriacus TaxID=106335 RepID=A0A6A2X2I2_HIBSY|nr:Plasmodesmata-located protein 8 isoform 1 [Hibiscus syriacus]